MDALVLIGMMLGGTIALVWTVVAILGWLMPLSKDTINRQLDLFDE